MRTKTLVVAGVLLAFLVAAGGMVLASERESQTYCQECPGLGLSQEQRQALLEIRSREKDLVAQLRQEMHEAHKERDWDRFGQLTADLARLRTEMMDEVREVLTEEQIELWAHRRQERSQGHLGPRMMMRGRFGR